MSKLQYPCSLHTLYNPFPFTSHPFLSTLFNLFAVAFCPASHQHTPTQSPPRATTQKHTCVRVLCPLTGNPCACLLPRYAPISLSLFIFSRISRRKSFSIFMPESAAVRPMACWLPREPTLAVGWMWKRAMRRWECWGPIP